MSLWPYCLLEMALLEVALFLPRIGLLPQHLNIGAAGCLEVEILPYFRSLVSNMGA